MRLDLDFDHGQQHCFHCFSAGNYVHISLKASSLHLRVKLTTVVKHEVNCKAFVIWAPSGAASQWKVTFSNWEPNSHPIASKEFREVFFRDQTKPLVDIICSVTFSGLVAFSCLSTMTITCNDVWKELVTSRTDIIQVRSHQSLQQNCELAFRLRHLESEWM